MTAAPPASLRLYGLASGAASLAAPVWLRARASRGKEDPARWAERLGRATLARPAGRLAWLHGVSVGESLSLLPLIDRLRTERPDVAVLVTSGTRASAELLAARLPPGAFHQYAPLDAPGAVARFLEHWRPELGVLAESELWPNLILGARARGVRLALLSARLSARSLAGWRRAPRAARAVLGAFDLLLARDAAAAERFAALGARVDGLADLKFGVPPLPVDEAEWARARDRLGARPVLLAASTHPGEEEIVLKAFQAAAPDAGTLLILAPRHPARGEAVARLARELGLAAGRRTSGDALGDAPVYVADTVGELGLWYRLAELAVIGGSLTHERVGGHNPLEPARLGCPFISGPEVSAWPVYEALEAARATRRVRPGELADWFSQALLGDPALAEMAARASAFAAAGETAAGEAAERVLELLDR
ncbi:MAG TPA: glycosyltransferase N-terminal domain-containing protein [Caulobacteraceae bacterium]|nr:glycosyltransferase N-terminal domain-containing protein [Caulobacteraceae bacterium]